MSALGKLQFGEPKSIRVARLGKIIAEGRYAEAHECNCDYCERSPEDDPECPYCEGDVKAGEGQSYYEADFYVCLDCKRTCFTQGIVREFRLLCKELEIELDEETRKKLQNY